MPPLPPRDLDHVLEHTGGVFKSLVGARFFITGGTGFVGSWLVETLLRADVGASAVLLTRDPDRFQYTNPHLSNHPALTVLRGDVRTFEFPTGEFPYVIHAAMPEPGPEADAEGMRHILDFAAAHGTRRFLFTSSGAVYGKQPPKLPHVPEDYVSEPTVAGEITAYGLAKRASESVLMACSRRHGFAALIARLFAFTGPRLPLDRNFAVGNFIRDALAGGPIRISGDGTPYRAYLYAADLSIWLWTVLLRGEAGRPYNVGSGQELTISELASIVARVAATGVSVEVAQKRVPGAPAMRYVPSVERAEQELGLRPVIALEEGVRRMFEWARTI